MLCTLLITHYLGFCPLSVIKIGIKTKLFRDRISSHPHTEQYNKKKYPTLQAIQLMLKG
jgi:hypothetical protein